MTNFKEARVSGTIQTLKKVCSETEAIQIKLYAGEPLTEEEQATLVVKLTYIQAGVNVLSEQYNELLEYYHAGD